MIANSLSLLSPVKASRIAPKSRSFGLRLTGWNSGSHFGYRVLAPLPMADIIVENLTVQISARHVQGHRDTCQRATESGTQHGAERPAEDRRRWEADYPGAASSVSFADGRHDHRKSGRHRAYHPDPGRWPRRIPAILPSPVQRPSQGRAVFTASASASTPLIGPAAPFPDADLHDNVRTVSNLISHRVTLNSSSLNLIEKLRTPLADTEIRFFGPNSTITIPAVFTHTFSVPLYRMSADLGVTTVENDYLLSGLTSYLSPVESAVSYENGGLAVSVRFADNPHALKSYSYLFPDIGVTHLKVKIFLPLNYNAHYQYFFIGTPKVEVTGQWQTSSPYGDLYNQVVVPITKQIADGVTGSMLAGKGTFEHLLNQSIHDLANGGRIVSANVMTNETLIAFETPN